MKKLILSACICLGMAATGCQALMENASPIARENSEILNMRNRSDGFTVINPDQGMEQYQRFGYVRHQRQTALPRGGNRPNIAMYDPELLADAISKLSVLIPDVEDVATLVTDSEVLVAYETTSENRIETADQVKRTAMSVVPRFFHVYVSDDPRMIPSIERFGSLSSTDQDVHDVIQFTIQEMLQSPQGYWTDSTENDEANENMGNSARFHQNQQR